MGGTEHHEEKWTYLFEGKWAGGEEGQERKKIVGQQSVIKNYTIYYVIH